MLEVLAKCSDYREQHLHEFLEKNICKKYLREFPRKKIWKCCH